jgi:flagellar biosynthesis protein
MPESTPPTEPPRRRATALRYEQGRTAPEVVATGAGHLADRILAAAREAGVPVRHDPALAEALAALDLGDDVPPALWTAVAEALAWAYRLDATAAGRRS